MTVPKRIHIRTYYRNNAITINSVIGETITSVMTKTYQYVSQLVPVITVLV